MAGKLGNDFNIGQPTDDDMVKQGAQWIRDIKTRIKSFLGVCFNLETGQLLAGAVTPDALKDLSPSPAGTWSQVEVNAKGQVIRGQNPTVAPTAYFPTGGVLWYPVAAVPNGFLLCDGRAVSRATYADLFAVVGATFGAGDGSTTFNLPDLRGRFLLGSNADHAMGERRGAETVTLTTDQLPSISLTINAKGTEGSGGYSGASANFLANPNPGAGTGAFPNVPLGTASVGNNQPHPNMPPFQAGNWLIKT